MRVRSAAFDSREQVQGYVESVLSLEVFGEYELSQIPGIEVNVELVDARAIADGVLKSQE